MKKRKKREKASWKGSERGAKKQQNENNIQTFLRESQIR